MNRFRRGRNVSQWAGVQTGPMTVDVDAVWANRDRNPVPPHPANDAVPPPVKAPAKYVSPLTAYVGIRAKQNQCQQPTRHGEPGHRDEPAHRAGPGRRDG